MDKVRIGIVGMGQRTCHHGGAMFKDCRDDVHLVAVCDNRPERLAHGKAMYEGVFGYDIAAYGSAEKMYAEAGLDGVFVAVPNYLHAELTIPALEAGIHVLCEKPMDVTLAKCDAMIGAAQRTGKILALGMQMHYRSRYHKITELIDAGTIGQVAMLWCTEYRGPFREMKDWVWEKAKSGGAIVEKNCHHYDVMDMWVQSPPTTVYATGNTMKHRLMCGAQSEIIDNAWIVNDYENGARGMVGICFLAQEKHYREFGVQGTAGRIFFSSHDGEIIHVQLNNGQEDHYDLRDELRGGVHRDFVDCIRSGGMPLVTGPLGKKSLLVPLAAQISMAEKRIVNVMEVR